MQAVNTNITPAAPGTPQSPVAVELPQGGPVIIGPGGRIIAAPGGNSPNAVYEAARNARSELRNQLARLEEQRQDIANQLQEQGQQGRPALNDVDKKGLEQRLIGIDARITEMEKLIAEADARVATTAAVPGAVLPPRPPPPQSGPPEEFWVITGIFMFVVVLPLTIAFARRIWRRGAAAVAAVPQDIYDRFNRIDQAIDSVAIEVERVGEGQRFLTRMYSEQQRALGAGPAERLDAAEREKERQRRGM